MVDGTQSITWADYASSVAVDSTVDAGSVSGQVAGSTLAYSVTSGSSNCSVDTGTGEVTGLAVGSCTITLTVTATGYDDVTKTNDVTVVTATMGAISWSNPYASGNLTVPATRTMSSEATIDSPSEVTLAYSSRNESVCTVDATGTISAVDDGSCVIRATFSKTGYYDATIDSAAITVVDGSPDAPAAPTVSSLNGVNTITWTAPATNGSAITGYNVDVSSSGSWSSLSGCQNITELTCDHSGLTGGDMYEYRVSATSSVGHSDWSPASAETMVHSAVPSAPSVPTVSSASGINTITWTAPADNGSAITDYEVQVNADSTGNYPDASWDDLSGCEASDLTSGSRSCGHSGLSGGDKYKYRVRAVNGVGNGVWSPASSEITVGISAPDAPAKPTVSSAIGANTITWTAPGNNGSAITAYSVQSNKADATGDYDESSWASISGCSSLAGNVLTCTHSGLVKDDKYRYQVMATNGGGNSAWSASSDEITVAYGTQSVTWAAYGSDVSVDSTIDAGAVSGQVAGSTLAYSVTAGSSNCSVDAGTGEVTGLAVGSCTITLTVSATGYDDADLTNDVTVITAAMGTATWANAYATGDLAVPGTRAVNSDPTIDSPQRGNGKLLIHNRGRMFG